MKRLVFAGLAGLIIGAVAVVIVIGSGANRFMIQQTVSPMDFDTTVAALETAVQEKGWEMPKVYRLDKTMEKHGHTVMPVAVMELCHPEHAAKILKDNDSRMVTPFMPCRISIYEQDNGDTVIARMNSGLMSNLFHQNVAEVMGVATQEVENIIEAALESDPSVAQLAP